jgi:hypothetical protein
MGLGGLDGGVGLLFVVAIGVFGVALLWLVPGRIFAQAGYSRWLGLIVAIPVANLIVLVWFAFAEWPIRVELERLRLNRPTQI